ncbi:hypothetical protein KR018_004805, partial [Drosophila ironensis]
EALDFYRSDLFLFIIFQQSVVFKFSNVICESYNTSWYIFSQCRLKAVSRDRVNLNIVGTILHPTNSIIVHLKVFKRENGYKPWLFDVKVDACRFQKKKYDGFTKMIYNAVSLFTNMNHTCPYEGQQVVNAFYLKPEHLLLPFPTGDYMLSTRWFFYNKLQFDSNVSFTFIEDL